MAGNGYATTSRKKILEYLMANSDRTVTVADIDQYLKKHDNEVNINNEFTVTWINLPKRELS